MNRFASIDWALRSLSLTIAVVEGKTVEVKDRSRTICSGSREFCMDAIRDYMVFFDGSDKKVTFHVYDTTGGSSYGVESKAYLLSKLHQLKSSSRAQMDIISHMSSYIP